MFDGLRQEGYISYGIDFVQLVSCLGYVVDCILEFFIDLWMIGDVEQYFVVVVLMVCQFGFLVCVVFGFVLQGVSLIVDVMGVDVFVWIEVDIVQYGWVMIDLNLVVCLIFDEQLQDLMKVVWLELIVLLLIDKIEFKEVQMMFDSLQNELDVFDFLFVVVFQVFMVIGIGVFVLLILLLFFLVIIVVKVWWCCICYWVCFVL